MYNEFYNLNEGWLCGSVIKRTHFLAKRTKEYKTVRRIEIPAADCIFKWLIFFAIKAWSTINPFMTRFKAPSRLKKIY